MRRKLAMLLGAAVMAVGPFLAPAKAAVVYYAGGPGLLPALNGLNFTYPELNESSATDAVPMYGAPLTSPPNPLSNVLQFRNLTNFAAASVSASPALDFVDGQLNVTIDAKPGKAIDSVSLYEFGDYTLARLLGTGDAAATAQSPGILVSVLEIDNLPVSLPVITGAVVYGPSGGSFSISGGDPWTGIWSAAGIVDLATAFGSGHVTKVAVSLDNQLLAASETNTSASIVKKGVDLQFEAVNAIPEPALGGLVLLCLPLALMRRGRRTVAAS